MSNIGVIELPARSNALVYEHADIVTVHDLLIGGQVLQGQAVAIDTPQDSEAKARHRGRLMRDYLALPEYGSLSTRARVVVGGAGTDADPHTYTPAITLRATNEPAEDPEADSGDKGKGKGKDKGSDDATA